MKKEPLVKHLLFLVALLPTILFADELIPTELRDALIERREAVKKWAITCPESWGEFSGQYSHVDGTCWQGDMTCFSGLSCLAAVLAEDAVTANARCSDIAAAQESSGRWVRGPTWVGKDYPDGDFSRDQTRGVFSYLLAKGYLSKENDYLSRGQAGTAAQMWLKWIQEHAERICLEDKRSCELTVAVHNMFYNVYSHLNLLPTLSRKNPLVDKFYDSRWYYRWGFLSELNLLWTETHLRGKWYPAHLKAANALLYRVMNMDVPEFSVRNRKAARVFGKAARRIWSYDKTNPFYRLLYEGVTRDLVDKVLSVYTSPTKPPALNGIHDWAWQRHTSERAWERSDGHDQVFLINLILARMNGRLNW